MLCNSPKFNDLNELHYHLKVWDRVFFNIFKEILFILTKAAFILIKNKQHKQ